MDDLVAVLTERPGQFHNDAINECGEGVLKHDLKEAGRGGKVGKILQRNGHSNWEATKSLGIIMMFK